MSTNSKAFHDCVDDANLTLVVSHKKHGGLRIRTIDHELGIKIDFYLTEKERNELIRFLAYGYYIAPGTKKYYGS